MEFINNLIGPYLDIIKANLGVVILGVVYMALEAWLGKTDKVKPGSVLEIIITPFMAAGKTAKEVLLNLFKK